MSIVDHVKLETNVYTDEKSQFVNFGKIGYTSLQSKNGLSCLFFNPTYDPNMIYRIVKKARIEINVYF